MTQIHILRFGGGSRAYHFENVETSSPFFGGVAANAVRLPGANGGFNIYGMGAPPREVGNIRVGFNLVDESPAGMGRKLDAVMAMQSWGTRPLWMQPFDTDQPRRWCSAVINNTTIAQSAKQGTEFLQMVTLNIQVADPAWHSRPNEVYFDQAHFGEVTFVSQPQVYLDDDETFGAVEFALERCLAAVQNGSEINLMNLGNAPTPARVSLMASRPWTLDEGLHFGDPGVMIGAYGSVSVLNPGVSRLNDWGDAVEGWRWNGTLGLNERLEADTREASVTRYLYPNFNESGYPNFTRTAGMGFITVQPGQNVLRVEGSFDGPFGWLLVDYDDTWL